MGVPPRSAVEDAFWEVYRSRRARTPRIPRRDREAFVQFRRFASALHARAGGAGDVPSRFSTTRGGTRSDIIASEDARAASESAASVSPSSILSSATNLLILANAFAVGSTRRVASAPRRGEAHRQRAFPDAGVCADRSRPRPARRFESVPRSLRRGSLAAARRGIPRRRARWRADRDEAYTAGLLARDAVRRPSRRRRPRSPSGRKTPRTPSVLPADRRTHSRQKHGVRPPASRKFSPTPAPPARARSSRRSGSRAPPRRSARSETSPAFGRKPRAGCRVPGGGAASLPSSSASGLA